MIAVSDLFPLYIFMIKYRQNLKSDIQRGGDYMSGLQEQAFQMIGVLSDENENF